MGEKGLGYDLANLLMGDPGSSSVRLVTRERTEVMPFAPVSFYPD